MGKIILKQYVDDDCYRSFEDLTGYDNECEGKDILIWGNRHYYSFGDETLLSILAGEYDEAEDFDYDPFEMLEKVTGKKWNKVDFIGYSQGEWQSCYYCEGVDPDYIKFLEEMYMGKYDVFQIYDEDDEEEAYWTEIPHSVVWKGKKAICDYADYNPDLCKVLQDDGYIKVRKYKEMLS